VALSFLRTNKVSFIFKHIIYFFLWSFVFYTVYIVDLMVVTAFDQIKKCPPQKFYLVCRVHTKEN